MAEDDASERSRGRGREGVPGTASPSPGAPRDDDREKTGDGPDLVKPAWDHTKDYPEVLAEGRTSTAVAIGLVAAALLGGGLWLAMRGPDGERPRPSAVAPTGIPANRPEGVPSAAPTWAPLGDGATMPGPAPTLAPIARPGASASPAAANGTARPGAATGKGPGGLPGIDRPRRPRPTPSDPRRAKWRQRLESFRDERRSILRDPSLSREQKRNRIEDLMRQQFRSRNPVPPPPPDLSR
ncbi:MAG: lipase secretion chaperone [Alphaproteobacteria bacterium]